MDEIVTIYIQLFDEGIKVFRPAQAVKMASDTYKILPSKDYDPEDEVWEFIPGTIVKGGLLKNDKGGEFLAALKKA